MKWITSLAILTLLILPSVYAIETTIQVTTEPNSFVMVRIFEAGSTNLLESILDKYTDFNNQITVKHVSEKSNLDIVVYIKEKPNGAAKYYKKYEGIQAGGVFNVSLPETATVGTSPPVQTQSAQTNDTNQTQPSNSTASDVTNPAPAITGNAIKSSELLEEINWYYIIAGAALMIVVVSGGIVLKKRNRGGPATPPKTPPGSTKDPKELEMKLEETQKRLEQATKEISRIKNEEQIKELQKSIDAQQEQIRKLQQGLS